MEKKHRELLVGIGKLRKEALELVKSGCRLEPVAADLDRAAQGVRQRLAYYAAAKPEK